MLEKAVASGDGGRSAEERYAIHEKRIRDAVALRTPDRVPVVPNGPAWPGRALGVPISEIATNPPVSRQTVVDAYTGLGDIDGIQSPAYHVCTLCIQWLSRVKRSRAATCPTTSSGRWTRPRS